MDIVYWYTTGHPATITIPSLINEKAFVYELH